MNNCIAHSEYTIGGRIYLNEFEDQIILTNPGSFLPGSIEPVLQPSFNPPFYRNQLLAETMVRFNMIDTQAMGIRRVFRIQQEKYFPLPSYDLTNPRQVSVVVYGKVLDENYTQVLFKNPDYDLTTVYLMDRVQKHEPISKEAVKYLRKLKVIEGSMPNIYISASLAASVEEKAQYVKNRGFEDEAYKKWILNYLETYKTGKKKDFLILLKEKLPDTMNDKQKEYKVQNLLQSLRREGFIETDSENHRNANWVLSKSKPVI
ncbi:MAG: ATP-binding protein [Clostridia bacterium]|nr:ATP-binding protein [Clostridia bacterium]